MQEAGAGAHFLQSSLLYAMHMRHVCIMLSAAMQMMTWAMFVHATYKAHIGHTVECHAAIDRCMTWQFLLQV
jgi:hypothetical protein